MADTPKIRASTKAKIGLAAALVLAASGGYLAAPRFAEPEAQDPMREFLSRPAISITPEQHPSTSSLAPVEIMLVRLEQRLQRQPGDVQGWILLAKSYYHLNRQPEAEQSFERALALGYAGDWQPLPRIDGFATSRPASIAIDDRAIGGSPGDDGPTLAALKLKVSLDPALAPQLPPGSSVYVFVRAADAPGPPLAVIRRKVAQLPLEIALNDSHAMMPGAKISAAKNLVAGARVSLTGDPERRPGDYEQLSGTIPSGFAETVELIIKNRI